MNVLKEVLYIIQSLKSKLYYGLAHINANTFKNVWFSFHVQIKTVFSITIGHS